MVWHVPAMENRRGELSTRVEQESAAGVSEKTSKVLLGHKNGDITTHYSAPELEELIEAANRVCEGKSGKTPALVVLKEKVVAA